MNGREDIANHTLELLKRLNGKMDSMLMDIGDIKTRLTVVEGGLSSMSVRMATGEVSNTQIVKRLDRVEERLGRIERRLELRSTGGEG